MTHTAKSIGASILCALAVMLLSAAGRDMHPELLVVRERETPGRAIYKTCSVRSKASGDFFIDRVELGYEVALAGAEELRFRGPVPPFATVVKCFVAVGNRKYKSDVYARFAAQKIYDSAQETETCGKMSVAGDVFSFDLKVSRHVRSSNQVTVTILWQQRAELFYRTAQMSERRYIFPRRSYYKHGAPCREGSSLARNEHGTCTFGFKIDFGDMPGWDIVCDEEYKNVGGNIYCIDGDGGDGDIVFVTRSCNKPGLVVREFSVDRHCVLQLSLHPPADAAAFSSARPREVVLVVDRSGSMGWGGSEKPYVLVQQAIETILSTVAGLDIFVNVVCFDHEVREEDDVLFKTSDTISVRNSMLRTKAKTRDMCMPRGGTSILAGLEKATRLPRVCLHEKQLDRNIILLTDGGDGNLGRILETVRQKARKDTRFFAIGIGTMASLDTVVEVAKLGRGSHDFLRSARDIASCLHNMLEKTGGTEVEYSYGELVVQNASVDRLVSGSDLCVQGGAVEVSRSGGTFKCFTNEKLETYLVFKDRAPGAVELRIGANSYTCRSEDFVRHESDSAKQEFAHAVNRVFDSALCELYGRRASRFGGQDDVAPSSSRLMQMFPRGDAFWDVYRSQIGWCVTKDILTADTALVVGDVKGDRMAWRTEAVETLSKQYAENYKQARSYDQVDSSFMFSRTQTDGPASSRASPKNREAPSSTKDARSDTQSILASLTRIFEEGHSISECLRMANEILSPHTDMDVSIDSVFYRNASELAKKTGIPDALLDRFLLVQIVVEVLGCRSKEHVSFVTCQMQAILRANA